MGNHFHMHSILRHGDRKVVESRKCGEYQDHVDDAREQELVVEAMELARDSAPFMVTIIGNAIEGYSLRHETEMPCGHGSSMEVRIFRTSGPCGTPSEEDESKPNLIMQQIAALLER